MYTKTINVATKKRNKRPGRPPGSATRKGDLKVNLVKLRVSDNWLDTLNQAREIKPTWFRGRNNSEMIRMLVLEGLLRFCYGEEDKELKDRINLECTKL